MPRKNTLSSSFIGVLTGGGALIFIALSIVVYRYMHSASQQHIGATETYSGVPQNEPNVFFHNGQLVYHTYG